MSQPLFPAFNFWRPNLFQNIFTNECIGLGVILGWSIYRPSPENLIFVLQLSDAILILLDLVVPSIPRHFIKIGSAKNYIE